MDESTASRKKDESAATEEQRRVHSVLQSIEKHGGIESLAENKPGSRLKFTFPEGERLTKTFGELLPLMVAANAEMRALTPEDLFQERRSRRSAMSPEQLEAMVKAVTSGSIDPLGDFLFGAESTASRRNVSGTNRVKGYASWKPHKKTKVILGQVLSILQEYEDYLPLTGRQIFYRLVGAFHYPKDERAYERLTNYLVRARRAGIIPFWKIRDDGAAVMAHHHYRDENAFYEHIRTQGEAYRRDKLANQDVDIRVYCEAAGMMPQLRDVCEPYSVPVYSCSGFDSLTAKYDLAQSIRNTFAYQGRKTAVLHLGDYDPSGESIFNDGLVDDVHAFLDRDVPHKDPEDVAIFERVALRPEHGDEYRLDPAPPKAKDSRTKNWSGTETYQLEALPPDVLAELLTDAIERHIDEDIYEEDLQEEEKEAQRIRRSLPAPTIE